jgi:hypothetical protein
VDLPYKIIFGGGVHGKIKIIILLYYYRYSARVSYMYANVL